MKRTIVVLTIVFLFVVLTLSDANAENKYWIGGTGSWDDPTNWDPSNLPLEGDTVYLTSSDAINKTVYYDNNTEEAINNMIIDGTGTGNMTLSISQANIKIPSVYDGDMYIGYNGTGTVNQSDGYVYRNHLSLGYNDGSRGTYNLSGGTLSPLTADVGETSTLNQTGGDLIIYSRHLWLRGTYNLSGNAYADIDHLIVYESGVVNQAGGLLRPDYTVSNYGTFNLKGGIVGGQHYRFFNYSTFNYSGGEVGITDSYGRVTNNGVTNLSGDGTRTIKAYEIVNNGTFKTTHTTAEYTGTFTNNGAYISDPSTQYFEDLIIGETGYLKGQYKDKFFISGDFINYSLMNEDWNTLDAYLGFLEGDDNLHDFYFAGEDFGATMSGYANNFSWGTLDIFDDILYLFDSDDEFGVALYLRELLGAKIFGDTVTNIFGDDGIIIYYNPHLRGNKYLAGLDYNLSGGGYLRAAVPEPATMLLLGIGLVGIAGVSRKKFIKK